MQSRSHWYRSHAICGLTVGPQKAGSQHTLAVTDMIGEKWQICSISMCRALGFMVDVSVGLGGVVGKIGGTRSPVEAKLSLGFSAAESPKVHVHGFHFFSDDGLVGNTQDSGVVCLD